MRLPKEQLRSILLISEILWIFIATGLISIKIY
jgi:hypothetical protein